MSLHTVSLSHGHRIKDSSELASLMLAKNFFKKVFVREDVPHCFYDDNGIFHCNLIDFFAKASGVVLVSCFLSCLLVSNNASL